MTSVAHRARACAPLEPPEEQETAPGSASAPPIALQIARPRGDAASTPTARSDRRRPLGQRDDRRDSRADAAGAARRRTARTPSAKLIESRSSSVRGSHDRCAARNARTSAAPADRRRATRLDRPELERLVQAAEAVAAKIDGRRARSRARAARGRSARPVPARARAPSRRGPARAARWCRDGARGRCGSRASRSTRSAASIVRSFSSVTSEWYGNPRRQAGRRRLVPGRHAGLRAPARGSRPWSARPRRAG